MKLTIILLEPENPGNTGAVCRVMKNFDFTNLLLINPKFDKACDEAKNRAKWANDVLENAKVIKKYDTKTLKKLRKDYDYLIATTARIGRDYNILRSPISPEQLAEKLKSVKDSSKIGLLFGREGSGLDNSEIAACDFVVTIPSSKKYPTMNISHSVSVVLYELFKASAKEHVSSHINPITEKDKEQLLKLLDIALDKMYFATEEKRETQRTVWKKMIGKSFMSKREAFALMGFLKKIK